MVRVQTHPPMESRNEYLVNKYKDRWLWCSHCRCAIVKYTCCGNTTCNAGGCDKCDETYDEVSEMRDSKLVPSIDQIAGARDMQRKDDLRYYMEHKESIVEEPVWWNHVQESFRKTGIPLMIPSEEEIKNFKPEKSFWDMP